MSALLFKLAADGAAPPAPAGLRRLLHTAWPRFAAGRRASAPWLHRLGLVLLLALLVAAPLLLSRSVLLRQQAERQAQGAQALAQALWAMPGPLAARLAALPAWPGAAQGEVQVTAADGRTVAAWRHRRPPLVAPTWFVSWLGLPLPPAVAVAVVEGQRLQIALRQDASEVLDLLWPLVLASTGAMLALAVGGGLVWRRQLRAVRAHGEATLRLNQQRSQGLFAAQAQQLEALRLQAHTDALTGLPNRAQFVAALDQALAGQGGAPQTGLVLLRLADLAGLNARLGHDTTDRVLVALAQVLDSYPRRIERCLAGRLNGADFALMLPVAGLTAETAHSLMPALRLAILRLDPQASVAAGAVELARCRSAAQALALADAALAEAELAGRYTVVCGGSAALLVDAQGQAVGEAAWPRRIARALALGQVALADFPVCTADGQVLHLDCPLRVRFEPGGALEPAQRWLSLAVRSRLCAQVDEKALALALAAILADGQARCVNIAAQSLASPEFVVAISRRLAQAPDAACRLWIDLPESLALERPMLVREVARQWRPLGARLALEHCGEGLMRIPQLIDLGLDCVRVDGRFVNGVAAPQAQQARRYLQGLVHLVQTVGLLVTAEGVLDPRDLPALWALGFDAATGPAVGAGLGLAVESLDALATVEADDLAVA